MAGCQGELLHEVELDFGNYCLRTEQLIWKEFHYYRLLHICEHRQSEGALPTKPQVGISFFVFKFKDGLEGPSQVTAAFGEPGGGTQYSTSQIIPVWTRAPVVFPLIP